MEVATAFSSPADREVASLIAALYALGRVDAILSFLNELFSELHSPASQLVSMKIDDICDLCQSRVYRFFSPRRSAALLSGIAYALKEFGSLERASVKTKVQGSVDQPAFQALITLRGNILRGAQFHAKNLSKLEDHQGDAGVLPGIIFPEVSSKPTGGGAAKRLMLFLRWMVRKDAVDSGSWTSIHPSQLIYPLDTHLMRITGELGIRKRKSADMATALEITNFFRNIDPVDPVRYDFSITRMGIHPRLKSINFISKFYEDPDDFNRYLEKLEV